MSHKKSALLVVDVQTSVVAKAYQREVVIKNINDLVTKARSAQVPVIWVQHSNKEMEVGSDGWKIVPELQPLAHDLVIRKVHGDSFEDTNLKAELDKRGVERLVVTGAQTDACIRSTIHGAFARGYDTVLVSDAHTTEDLSEWGLPKPADLINFTNEYWKWQTGSGKVASVVKTTDVNL